MSRGPLYDTDYKPHFTGHETFPLRYGWLKKAFDATVTSDYSKDNRSIFRDDDAIARFGVGKNMVASMRHWATSVGVIADDSKTGTITPTELGNLIFGDAKHLGLDPYLEDPSSLWLIHWQLCSLPNKTTWYYVFNHYPSEQFDRSHIVDGLMKLSSDRDWGRVSAATVRRDVECFVRSYVTKPATGKASPEDSLESPLAELGLIKPIGKRDGFRLVRGSKPSLKDGVFLYALVEFWKSSIYKDLNQIPFDFLVHAPGSPARVFLLDENSLAERLMQIDSYSDNVLSWSETSGMKTIIKNANRCFRDDPLDYVKGDFSNQSEAV